MKIFILGFLSLLVSSVLFAQTSGTITYYRENTKYLLRQESHLKFKPHESLFFIRIKGGNVIRTPEGIETTEGRQMYDLFLDAKAASFTKRHYLKSKIDSIKVYAEYKPEPIEWEIANETKTILGYKVQKAIAKKHPYSVGSDYDHGSAIAWFAIDLPYNIGPYTFWGLPGIILELTFTGIPTLKILAEKIVLEPIGQLRPNQGIKVTKEQLEDPDKIDKKWLKNARELLNSEN